MSYVDFDELKKNVCITKVAELLELKLKKEGDKFRAPCPVCGTNPRSLVISTRKNVFYCHTAQLGGDQIALAAHVLQLGMKEAALHIHNAQTIPEKVSNDADTLQALSYLEHDHALVETIGFEPNEAEVLGIGYAPKGVMRGTVAVPLRTIDGALVGYIGITDGKLPKSLKIPGENIVEFKKRA